LTGAGGRSYVAVGGLVLESFTKALLTKFFHIVGETGM